MKRRMNLRFFGHGDPGAGDPTPPTVPATPPPAQPQTAVQIDYEKIAQLVTGKQTVTEDSVLKGYFKQQGLSQEEMTAAINAFKSQKAAQQPDVSALQAQATQAQATAQKAQIESKATVAAVALGIDVKTIPYMLKMADFSQAVGQDGAINEEALTNALNKVLEDVPALKPQPGQASGFTQVGASGQQQQTNTDDALKKAFGL